MAESMIGGLGHNMASVTIAGNVALGNYLHIPSCSGTLVIGNDSQYITADTENLIIGGVSNIAYGYPNEIQNVAIRQPIYADDGTGTSTAPTTGKFIHR